MKFTNPIIRGFYPDPSVCKANGKYYLATSSFHYFAGVPLFESSDLVNWKQIGHCLSRPSQLPLKNVHSSGGIFAPTIRFYNNRFYMTTTNSQNFFVYTDDIYGSWSEPIYIKQGGIDPSLYFEEDKSYFLSTHSLSNGKNAFNKNAIFACEIDIQTGKQLSESKPIWQGTGGRYLEAPHLYKIGDYYYLLAAEGGTEYGHFVTLARSKSIFGEYVSCPHNPILTNRNLGGYIVQGVGHADLLQDYEGNWWLFHLGFRQIDEWLPFHHLGREVFLVNASFGEDGWLRTDSGTTPLCVQTSRISEAVEQKRENEYTLQNLKRDIDFCFLRQYCPDNYIFEGDYIKMKSNSDTLEGTGSPTFAAIRQKEFDMELCVDICLQDKEAGVSVYMDENHRYDLFIESCEDKFYAVLRLCIGSIRHIAARKQVKSNNISIKITATPLAYSFFLLNKGEEQLLANSETRYLSSEVAGGFCGVVLALYTQNGTTFAFNKFSNLKITYPAPQRLL